jgi:hypothetical protein
MRTWALKTAAISGSRPMTPGGLVTTTPAVGGA